MKSELWVFGYLASLSRLILILLFHWLVRSVKLGEEFATTFMEKLGGLTVGKISVGGLASKGYWKTLPVFPTEQWANIQKRSYSTSVLPGVTESPCLSGAVCWTKDSHRRFCVMLRKCVWSETLQSALLRMWSRFWLIDLELYVLCLGINRAEAFLVKGGTSPTQPKVIIPRTQILQREQFSILIFIFYLFSYSSWLLIVLLYSLSI